jgi:asparagine synthase (glutamine-hydrolysing)
MCGIAGIYNFNGSPVEQVKLEAMARTIRHRGPDDAGFWRGGPLGLAHRRLSIIDLTEAAHQPMTTREKDLVIVFNGEIYNFLELKRELDLLGHSFRSSSDTEVVLAAYRQWGTECVTRFNGMWAFALWDEKNRTLFCSRDRFGVKPFYYLEEAGRFIFGSEIKAILAVAPEAAAPNYPYLRRFLTTGIFDDGDETCFERIRSLPPAHSLILGEGQRRTWRYWDINPGELPGRYDYAHPETALRDLLSDSVRLRLRSDVPVGTCLSGGLDSSSIVCLASSMLDRPVRTFSSLYEDPDCDERFFIEKVRDHCATESFFSHPQAGDLFQVLPRMVWHQDEPSAGPGLYSQWHVMQLARGRVKVLLDGQGGDEVLGGYFYFYPNYFATLVQMARRGERLSYILRILREYPRVRELTGQRFTNQVIDHIRELVLPRFFNNLFRMPKINLGGRTAPGVLHPDFIEWTRNRMKEPPFERKFDLDLDDALYQALTRHSIPALLHYEDRNSMAFSIEARTPFLDYRLVEFCLGLPFDEKINGIETKYLLRKSMKDLLPPEISGRRDKKGYPTPFARWLREDRMAFAREILDSPECRSRNILNPEGVEDRLRRHLAGEDFNWEIWRFITLELWMRIFMDRTLEAAPE